MIREIIGYSEEGRPLSALLCGGHFAPFRIMIIAGQHGDEPLARAIVSRLGKYYNSEGFVGNSIYLAVLDNANPDGSAKGIRENARGVDLNRDHQLLKAVETRVLHNFVRKWRPHLIIDVHTYPPRRKHLLRQNLIYCHDVFIDMPNNPSLGSRFPIPLITELLQAVITRMNTAGFRCDRYTLIKDSGRIRHSAPGIVDARNGLALRYGIPTVLVEGRQPSMRKNSETPGRIEAAMELALKTIITWGSRNCGLLTQSAAAVNPGEEIVIRSRYILAKKPPTMAFKMADTGQIREICLPGRFTPKVEAIKCVVAPRAYAVPKHLFGVIQALERHGIAGRPIDSHSPMCVDRYWIDAIRSSSQPHRAFLDLSTRVSTGYTILKNYLLFPVTDNGGHILPVFLEPESKYCLFRCKEINLQLRTNMPYPILRISSL
ncbi:MAG: hypothetical protein MRJ65_03200 [Candidatus Brocadiaceae bacterium]|nr:hypothetical protein [Candidatus Brocadiaceae bacterium]